MSAVNPESPYDELYKGLYRDKPETFAGLARNKAGAALLRNNGFLLDIGCGVGDLFEIVKDRYDEVHGVDIIQEAVDLCVKKGIRAKRVDLNIERLPYENDKFDSVACFDFVEHILSPERLTGEIWRVLKWGGEVVIITPNIRSIWHILRLIFKGRAPKTAGVILEPYDGGHIHYFTSRAVMEILTRQGFQNISLSGWSKVLSRLNWLPTRFLLGPTIDREFLHGGLIIRAEKVKR